MRYDIKITRIKDESSNLLGYADVSLGGAFAIKGIKIMNGSNGPFVSMPNYKSKRISEDGEPIYKDVCYASKADFRKELTSNVLAAYEGNDSPSISKVSCAILANDGNLKGIADVTFNDSFVVKGVKIMDSEKGVFVSMPNYRAFKDGQDEFRDICFPITAEFRNKLYSNILSAYDGSKKPTITDVKCTAFESDNLKGIANVTFDDCFVVSGVKIMDGNNGLFVSMPNYKALKDGQEEFHDICFPTTAEFREEFNNAVMDAFNKSLDLSKEAPDLAEDERPVSRGRSR